LPDYSALARRQLARLAEVRGRRDGGEVQRTREALRRAALDRAAPLLPPIIEAVRARATLGEISDTLRDAWGVHGR
jgi:methylmalonyl-CoA mutase